jgi:hypothetical protein
MDKLRWKFWGYNKSKGKFTVVADDPALIWAKEQQRIINQVEYNSKRKDNSSQINSHFYYSYRILNKSK